LGLQLLRQHPLAGVGFNQFLEFNDLTAHNSYVLCFAELGVVGYFLWIALIVVSARQLNGLMAGSEDAEFVRWTSAVQKSLFAFLASAFFLSRTYSPSLYVLLGIITGLYAFSRNDSTVLARPFWDCTWRTAAAGFSSIACIYAFIVATHLLGQ
jgi:O-antigen ligase